MTPIRERAGPERWVAVLLVGLLVASGLVPIVMTAPVRADGMAVFSFNPSSVEVHPGETFTVGLNLRSSPQFANGVEKAGVAVVFNETFVEATGIQRGPFMNLREETTVETNMSQFNNEEGYVIYELVRDPPKGGAYGYATFAAFEFEVEQDAPNGTFEIGVYRSRILLTDGMYQRVRKGSATVAVTGSSSDTTTDRPTRSDRTTVGSSTAASVGTTAAGATGDESNGGLGIAGAGLVLAGVGLFGGIVVLVRQFVPASTDDAQTDADS